MTEITAPEQPRAEPDPLARGLLELWGPWVDLRASGSHPLMTLPIPHLMAWLRDGVAERPWFAMLAVAGTRAMVLRQAGRDDLSVLGPDELGRDDPSWALLATSLRQWEALEPEQRVLVAWTLNCLTMQETLLSRIDRLPHPTEPGGSEQLTYELSRGLQQLHRNRRAPARAFEFLARAGADVQLRVLSCTQLAARAIRAKRNADDALPWLTLAAQLLSEMDDDDFTRHLVASRYHRCAALYHTKVSDFSRQAAALELAAETDARLAGACGGSEARLLVARENRRILLESRVKAAIGGGGGDESAREDLIRRFEALDPWCPETLYFVALLLERAKQLAGAADYYVRAAEMGTARGMQAAAAAGRCYRRLGLDDRADRAERLAAELDR